MSVFFLTRSFIVHFIMENKTITVFVRSYLEPYTTERKTICAIKNTIILLIIKVKHLATWKDKKAINTSGYEQESCDKL